MAATETAPLGAPADAPRPTADDGRDDGAPPRAPWARARVLVPGYLLVALGLTWPLALHLTDALTIGTESVATVPLFNLWTLRWDQLQLPDLFRHAWDAPIFHPTTGTFALSEPQPLTGLAFAPVAWITGNPVLAYNAVLLAVLTLNGYAAFRLSRRFTDSDLPAVLGGVLGVALPFVTAQLGVLQLTVVFPLFLLVEAIVVWAADGERRWALAMGTWLAATFLTCGYYGLFASLVFGLAGVVLVRRSWWTARRGVDLLLAAALFAVLALPVAGAQARLTAPYERTTGTIAGLSAQVEDFLRLPDGARGTALEPWTQTDAGGGHELNPGLVLLVLAVVGLATTHHTAAVREVEARDHDEDRAAIGRLTDRRRALNFLATGIALSVVLAFGLHLRVGDVQPYEAVRTLVPGFKSLRSPFRFAAVAQVLLVPLAALGLAVTGRALRRVRPDGDRVATTVSVIALVGLVVLAVAEVSIVPLHLVTVDRDRPDWATFLAEAPRDGVPGDGAVAVVPFPPTGKVADYEETTKAMLALVDADRPLVNGYSGLWPASYDTLEATMRRFPDPDATARLREHGVTYVVVTHAWTAEHGGEPDGTAGGPLTPERGYTRVFTGADADVYLLSR